MVSHASDALSPRSAEAAGIKERSRSFLPHSLFQFDLKTVRQFSAVLAVCVVVTGDNHFATDYILS